MSYLQSMDEDRRLFVLRLLQKSGTTANERVLLAGIKQAGHLRVTFDQMRTDLEWLKDRGLVTHAWPADDLLVATLTRRGNDVADGNSQVEGVKIPDPFDDA